MFVDDRKAAATPSRSGRKPRRGTRGKNAVDLNLAVSPQEEKLFIPGLYHNEIYVKLLHAQRDGHNVKDMIEEMEHSHVLARLRLLRRQLQNGSK